jgi:AraC-like DNA-binding protein
MPIKQICVLTGYARMTNFITAFRKKFGYTPGSLRRK